MERRLADAQWAATLNFQADGETLTGTVTNKYGTEQITDGAVKIDAVSFLVLAGSGGLDTYKRSVSGQDMKFHHDQASEL